MSEAAGPDHLDADVDSSASEMHLANLITDAVSARSNGGAQWLSDNAIDPQTGNRVFKTRQVAWSLMTKPKRAFLEPDQFRALVALFGWAPEFLRDACLVTIGIPMPNRSGVSQRANQIPPGVDDLPERRWVLHLSLLSAAVEDHHNRKDSTES